MDTLDTPENVTHKCPLCSDVHIDNRTKPVTGPAAEVGQWTDRGWARLPPPPKEGSQ